MCVRVAREKKGASPREQGPKDRRNLAEFVVDPDLGIRRLNSPGEVENVAGIRKSLAPTKGQWRRTCIESEVNVRECVRVTQNTACDRVLIRCGICSRSSIFRPLS